MQGQNIKPSKFAVVVNLKAYHSVVNLKAYYFASAMNYSKMMMMVKVHYL